MLSTLFGHFFLFGSKESKEIKQQTRREMRMIRNLALLDSLAEQVKQNLKISQVLREAVSVGDSGIIVASWGTCKCNNCSCSEIETPSLVIRHWWGNLERIFGYTPYEAKGLSVCHIIPERFREKHMVGVARYHDTQETKSVYIGKKWRTRGLTRNGHEVDIILGVSVLRDGGDREHLFGAHISLLEDYTKLPQLGAES